MKWLPLCLFLAVLLSLSNHPQGSRVRGVTLVRSAAPSTTAAALRRGVAWQRATTYRWQDYAQVPRTPTSHAELRTRSAAYLRWIGSLWNRRRLHARTFARSLNRGSVPDVICRVFRGPELCSTALYIAYRESRFQVTAWNSSDHGGLFQLGGPERQAYASIGYSTAYEQTVAAHNLYQARGWQPWAL